MSNYAIWWTSQGCCELMATAFVDAEKSVTEEVLDTFGLPKYIAAELSSRFGRAGRGRLWIPGDIPIKEIPWPETKITAFMANHCGGIVIHAKDVPAVIALPGFVTDLDLNFWKDGEG